MKKEQTEGSETSAYKIQTPGNYPEETIKHSEHGESLKSRICMVYGNLTVMYPSPDTDFSPSSICSLLICTKIPRISIIYLYPFTKTLATPGTNCRISLTQLITPRLGFSLLDRTQNAHCVPFHASHICQCELSFQQNSSYWTVNTAFSPVRFPW